MNFKGLQEKYKALKPQTQQKLTVLGVVLGIATGATAFYFVSPFRNQAPPVDYSIQTKTSISVDPKTIEKSTSTQLESQKKEIDELKDMIVRGNISPAMANQIAQGQKGQIPGQNGQQPFLTGQPGQPGQPNAQGRTPQGSGRNPSANTLMPLGTVPQGQQQLQFPQNNVPVNGNAPINAIGNAPINATGNPLDQALSQQPTNHAKRSRGSGGSLPPLPVPPGVSESGKRYPAPPSSAGMESAREEIVGGIAHAANHDAEKIQTKEDKKKAKHTVYLPPSFMEAHLLSGLNAPVASSGKTDPVPVIIRVAAPAQLPNEVKMGLKGCFVIGEGVGDLSQERALVRLVSLSCLSKNGNAVIDQNITGFVQDADAKPGLAGNVVAKFGSVIARAFLGGLAEGIGQAATQAGTTTSSSALGTTTTLNPANLQSMGMVAAGQGLASATKEINKFYMELAHQSLPVIEVGSGKPVTLIITKGVNLEIKNFPSVNWY